MVAKHGERARFTGKKEDQLSPDTQSACMPASVDRMQVLPVIRIEHRTSLQTDTEQPDGSGRYPWAVYTLARRGVMFAVTAPAGRVRPAGHLTCLPRGPGVSLRTVTARRSRATRYPPICAIAVASRHGHPRGPERAFWCVSRGARDPWSRHLGRAADRRVLAHTRAGHTTLAPRWNLRRRSDSLYGMWLSSPWNCW